MDCSFAPDRSWFVFDAGTGATLAKGFKTKRQAVAWMVANSRPEA